MEDQRDRKIYVIKVEEEEVEEEVRVGKEDEELLQTISGEMYSPLPSSCSSFTCQITESQTKPKAKQIRYYRRPSTNIPFIPSIRILKRDIRRKYVQMISNVMNSHDVSLFSSFIDEFYHPNFLYFSFIAR